VNQVLDLAHEEPEMIVGVTLEAESAGEFSSPTLARNSVSVDLVTEDDKRSEPIDVPDVHYSRNTRYGSLAVGTRSTELIHRSVDQVCGNHSVADGLACIAGRQCVHLPHAALTAEPTFHLGLE